MIMARSAAAMAVAGLVLGFPLPCGATSPEQSPSPTAALVLQPTATEVWVPWTMLLGLLMVLGAILYGINKITAKALGEYTRPLKRGELVRKMP